MAIADVAAANGKGFTLIELMVGLAILALLFLLGMPTFITFLRNSEIRSTSESIINGLRTASAEATRVNSRVAFTFGPGASWKINAINDPATDTDCTDLGPVIQQFDAKEAGNAKVTLTPSDKAAVCFTGLGRVWRPPAAGKPRGLRMCDPDPALAALVPPDPRAC